MRCALYRVATGLELRFEYEDRDHSLQSRLSVCAMRTRIATLADDWHQALMAKGFEHLPV